MTLKAVGMDCAWIAICVLALGASGCVLDERPGLRACAGGYWFQFRRGPSDDDLPVLPSAVPGVEIDSAEWRTRALNVYFGTEVRLLYGARLRTERPLQLDSIALVYRADGSSRLFSKPTYDEGWSIAIDAELREPPASSKGREPEDREHLIVPAGSVLRTSREVPILKGFVVISSSGVDICPRSVQLVPRQQLLRYVAPELFSAPRLAALLARQRAGREPRPLEVVFDTLLPDGRFKGLVAGIAINTTDSILPSMLAAIVVDSADPARPADSVRSANPVTRDTLEYYLGPVAPHSVRTFVGGRLGYERVIERTSYSASAVQGRRIATGLDDHWASRAHYDEPENIRELEQAPR